MFGASWKGCRRKPRPPSDQGGFNCLISEVITPEATPRYQCYRLLMGFRHPGAQGTQGGERGRQGVVLAFAYHCF